MSIADGRAFYLDIPGVGLSAIKYNITILNIPNSNLEILFFLCKLWNLVKQNYHNKI